MATAAKVRVRCFDRACNPRNDLARDLQKIRSARLSPADGWSNWAWGDWYENSFIHTIERAHNRICEKSGGIDNIRICRVKDPKPLLQDGSWKKECQSAVYQFIVATHLNDPRHRVRKKYDRWILDNTSEVAIHNTPRWRAEKAHWLLTLLGKWVTPRVQSAVFSACWNRWTTAGRFQKFNACLLCHRENSEDKLEHYCKCSVIKETFSRFLRMDPSKFACLHTFVMVNHELAHREEVVLSALLIYGVYTLTNRLRHNRVYTCTSAVEALKQAIREGAKGHSLSMRTLDNRWKIPYSCTPLPPRPFLPFNNQVTRWRSLVHGQIRKRRRED